MRSTLAILGVLLIVAGCFWALQGAGLVMWPASSFMLQQGRWVTYGIAAALVGVALIALGRRRRP
jgi:MYXO-CTERM domain-containing protein